MAKKEMALVPIEKYTSNGLNHKKPQLETRVTMDALTFKTRSLVMEATEIKLEIVRVRTEREEALVRTLR